ncbi:MAG: translocation/assembly module TamB domain-containing protein [Gammaproteobacteria bacterium]|nr:translocation/assembly module TamB domain-containing protein [Gammaproteobacteria bacterium]MDH5803174.1 translocation/assembly module TamB domain-containing protein [Gammaproteobacteria bacterium]
MRRLTLMTSTVLLLPLVVIAAWLLTTQSGLNWVSAKLATALPGELSITGLKGSIAGKISLDSLTFKQEQLAVSSGPLRFELNPMALLSARIHLDTLHAQSITVELPPSKPTSTDTGISFKSIELPWRILLDDIQVDQVHIKQANTDIQVQEFKLQLTTLLNRIKIKKISGKSGSYAASAEGEFQLSENLPHHFEIQWKYQTSIQKILLGQIQIDGNTVSTQINQVLSGPVQARMNANIKDLLQNPTWQLNADISAFQLTDVNSDWPAITGKMNLFGDGDLQTAQLQVDLDANHPELGPILGNIAGQRLADNSIVFKQFNLTIPNRNAFLHGSGHWHTKNYDGNHHDENNSVGKIDGTFQWQNLRWPIKGKPWFDSAYGTGWFNGTPDKYRIGLATDRPWKQAPASLWFLSADGDKQGLQVHSLRINALEGETVTQGTLVWTPRFHWQADSQFSAINPAIQWPEWPGNLSGTVASEGGWENDRLLINTTIKQLKGKLRTYPVRAQGQIKLDDSDLNISKLQIRSATSRIDINGQIANQWDLRWNVTSNRLGDLYPLAKGKLKSLGHISGPLKSPTIQGTATGSAISIGEASIGNLDAKVDINPYDWRSIKLALQSNDLSYKTLKLKSWILTANPDSLRSTVRSKAVNIDLKLDGKATAQQWYGKTVTAAIDGPKLQSWRLQKPAEVSITPNAVYVGDLCFQNISATFCSKLKQQQSSLMLNIQMQHIPIALLSPWIDTDVSVAGIFHSQAALNIETAKTTGHLDIQLPPGVVTHTPMTEKAQQWHYQGGDINITLNPQGLNAKSNFVAQADQRLQTQVSFPGFSLSQFDFENQRLNGKAHMTVRDLIFLEAMIPEVHKLTGNLQADFSVVGTIRHPKFNGRMTLNQSQFQIPRLGLNIDQVKLDVHSSGADAIDYQLKAHSGDGQLTLQGKTALTQKPWSTTVKISGQDFQVARIPEAHMQVSPDLNVTIQPPNIEVTGELVIPKAKLQPKDISTAIQPSGDVIIVDREQEEPQKWNIRNNVRLSLGDNVTFYGFGFDGLLGGSIVLKDEPDQLTQATGQIKVVKGRYRAYGQRLDVENGQLVYAGGPLMNPGLDFKATRKTGPVTAGLKVRGSLHKPEIELFSVPAMGQTEALSYLILGRSIENTSNEEGATMAKAALAIGLSGGDQLARTLGERFGLDEMRVESSAGGEQAYLVIGRYLSPKLYVSYGVGLLESVNTFNVRYEISDKWQLKGESGEQHGADFLYTIER